MLNFTARVAGCKLCMRPPVAHRSELTNGEAAFGTVECTSCGISIKVTALNVNEHRSILDEPSTQPLIERIELEAATRWNRLHADLRVL